MRVNSSVDSKKKGLPTWLREGLEKLEKEKLRKAEQEVTKKKRKKRWSDAGSSDEDNSYLSQQQVVERNVKEMRLKFVVVYNNCLVGDVYS